MNTDIKLFTNNELGNVRTILNEKGDILFCLRDVCDILGLGNPSQVKSRLEVPYLISNEVWVQTGIKKDGSPAMRNTNMIFVNEPGLYQCIFISRKPIAQKFTRWVTEEVIPSIRQNGYYQLPKMTIPQILQGITTELVKQENDIKNINNRLDRYETHLQEVTTNYSRLEENYNTLSDNYNELHTNYTELRSEQNRLTEDYTRLSKDYDELDENHAKLRKDQDDFIVAQEEVIKSSYLSIKGFCNIHKIALSLSDRNMLGRRATTICKKNDIIMGKEPDDNFGYVNTYPYSVLQQIFNEYINN